jgi:uncharacterized membrane protein YgdD (TMEM256/DUF423 family)
VTLADFSERNPMRRTFILLGAVNGFLAVALGAFAAHMLRDTLDPHLYTVFQTGVDYQATHALALLAVGMLSYHLESSWLKPAGWLLFTGILLFSGSLYLLSLTGIKGIGIITPLGGTAFLLGWAALGIAALRGRPLDP